MSLASCHRNSRPNGPTSPTSDCSGASSVLEHLAEEDQQTIIRLIGAFVAQQRIAAVLTPVD